jgi:hypothetical protein
VTNIIVWHGKHDTVYFDASTPEVWAASCLRLLGTMDRDYQFYNEWPEADILTDEQIEAMPEPYRTRAREDAERTKHENRHTTAHNMNVREIKRVLAENDTSLVTRGRGTMERQVPLAWLLLEDRSDHEYEHVEIREVWTP